jgi:FkbM family methyltransferase
MTPRGPALPTRRELIRMLDRPLLRWPLALAGSVLVSRRNRELCLVTPIGDGLFAHRYRNGAVVYPTFRGSTPRTMERETVDTFCWQYRPVTHDVVLDVGAGIGEEAMTFSRMVGPTGRVVCIEAHPSTYGRLVFACELNGLANVTTVWAAVTDRPGKAYIEDIQSDTHVGAAMTRRGGTPVPAETLDALTRRLGLNEIALLKMNIEGAERLALRGGQETLRRTRFLAISCHDFLVDYGADPSRVATLDDVRALVEANGFDIATRPSDKRSWVRFYVYGRRSR